MPTFVAEMTLLTSYFPITDPTFVFFVVLMIILFAPIVMSKLRIPHIIGMVLAGIMIGQYDMAFISWSATTRLNYSDV